MGELILREAVLAALSDCGICIQRVADIPTVDIQDCCDGAMPELIRCKDCIHWVVETYPMCKHSFPGDFCSRAAKEEQNEVD